MSDKYPVVVTDGECLWIGNVSDTLPTVAVKDGECLWMSDTLPVIVVTDGECQGMPNALPIVVVTDGECMWMPHAVFAYSKPFYLVPVAIVLHNITRYSGKRRTAHSQSKEA